MFTNYSVSTESVFGTTYQRKFKLMYHMLALKIYQKNSYRIMKYRKDSDN